MSARTIGRATIVMGVALWSSPAVGAEVSANPTEAHVCPDDLLGAWTGMLDVRRLFGVRIAITERSPETFVATLRYADTEEDVPIERLGDRLRFQSASRPIAFDARGAARGGPMDLFVTWGSRLAFTHLPKVGRDTWATDWNALEANEERARFDLYVGEEDGRVAGGYFFFRDQRLPALFGEGLTCTCDRVRLEERNLKLELEGVLDRSDDVIRLDVSGPAGSAPIIFRRVPDTSVPEQPDAPDRPPRATADTTFVERIPEAIGDGWPTALPSDEGVDSGRIAAMVRAIVERDMTFTHSVLVVRHGRLVVEEYFYGFGRDTRHDMRSASKTLASTLVGLAVQSGHLPGAEVGAISRLPYRRYDNWDPRKATITLRHLMTMSSGLDANDSARGSQASERAYQSQRAQPDWVKLALDAPMIADPGSQPLYGGASPLILGGVLTAVLPEPLEWFAHRQLFDPLDFADYEWFLDPVGNPYLGGGMWIRPRDMAKIGQLYLDGGTWNGRRLLPESWVRESWGRYGRLAPLDRNGHEYGYLWWHHVYEVDGTTIETVEARGNGGQYLFVVPALDLVVVITSGNFRNGRTRQPEDILEQFVLPAVSSS